MRGCGGAGVRGVRGQRLLPSPRPVIERLGRSVTFELGAGRTAGSDKL
jgi:hypothetical protein